MSEGIQNTNMKEHKNPYVHCSIIYNRQDMEVVQMSISKWVDKTLQNIYTMEYYSAIKKKRILPFESAWMDLENIPLSKISQWEKDKHYMISLICGI